MVSGPYSGGGSDSGRGCGNSVVVILVLPAVVDVKMQYLV